MSIKQKTAVAASVVGLLSLAACGGGAAGSAEGGDGAEINLIGYSVLEQANKAVIEGFEGTDEGADVTFRPSYGASGDQSRAVEAGQDADEVHFSLEPDITRLVDAGLVSEDWKDNETKGICTQSVVVFVVRPGNPEGLTGWDDLSKPGVGIVTPNPASSGSAKWNLLSAYGHVLANGGSEEEASSYIEDFFANVVALPDSGRDATTAFESGNGDVLLSYENEAILAQAERCRVRLRHPRRDAPDREPVHGDRGRRPGRGGVPGLPEERGGPGGLRRHRLPPPDRDPRPQRRRRQRPGRRLPGAEDAADHRRGLRWLGRGEHEVLRRERRHPHQDPGRGGPVVVALTATPAVGRPARARRAARPGSLTRASALGLGVSMTWFSLLVLIPLSAVVVTAAGGGWETFAETLTNGQTLAALRLTVATSVGVTALNMVMGTVIAWVLVRDRFPGKRVLDVVIDIPFALPTIVAGLVLLSLYGTGSPVGVDVANTRVAVFLAIAFVTLPFVVRTVQPVLEEMEADVEEAAASLGASRATTFRRVVLPTLVPAIFAGAALSFARGISEYGSLVLLSGNLPNRTEVTSVRVLTYLEGGNTAGAAAVATVMLVVALLALLALDLIQRRVARRG